MTYGSYVETTIGWPNTQNNGVTVGTIAYDTSKRIFTFPWKEAQTPANDLGPYKI
jgi:hypothetical protein